MSIIYYYRIKRLDGGVEEGWGDENPPTDAFSDGSGILPDYTTMVFSKDLIENININSDYETSVSSVFYCDTTSNDIYITLPLINDYKYRIYQFVKNSANNNIIITPSSGEPIDGGLSITISGEQIYTLTNDSVYTWTSSYLDIEYSSLYIFGPQGDDGLIGPVGDVGPTGPTGVVGADGPVGPIGPVGPAGTDGPVGPPGADGADGPIGPTGPTGAVGPAGADGAIGPVGPQGEVGPAGAVGPVGEVGPPGADGLDGVSGITESYYMAYQVPVGTNGGSAVKDSWRTLQLNHYSAFGGSNATLSGNTITLQPGTWIIDASQEFHKVGEYATRIYNKTNNTTILRGNSGYSKEKNMSTVSKLVGVFEINTPTQIEFQYYVDYSKSNYGLGRATGFGSLEKYTQILLIKQD
jgi:hypothetical protein